MADFSIELVAQYQSGLRSIVTLFIALTQRLHSIATHKVVVMSLLFKIFEGAA